MSKSWQHPSPRSPHHHVTSRGRLNASLHSTQSLTGRSSIMTYRNTQYPSASAALEAYISDFENQNPSMTYHRTVEDLLSPRSLLQLTIQRSLETGVRDTVDEVSRYDVKKMLDESYHQIMRADAEMQKARDLVKSSKLLSQSPSDPYLSPLPGSSNITDQLTDITMSTDAMVQAPAYPQKLTQSTRVRTHSRQSDLLEQTQGEGTRKGTRLESTGRDTYRRTGANRTLHSSYKDWNTGETSSGHLHDSTEAIINNPNHKTQNLYRNHTTLPSSSRIPRNKSLSSTQHQQPYKESAPHMSRQTSHAMHNETTSKAGGLQTTRRVSSEGRPPPSWIEELEVSGRPPPSWIQDLDTSGRPPPRWIQDLDVSGVTLSNTSASHKEPIQSSRYKHIAHTLEANRPGNMRHLTSASELLMSARETPNARTPNKSRDLTVADLGRSSTSSDEERYNSATRLGTNMYEEHKRRTQHHRKPLNRSSYKSYEQKAYEPHTNSEQRDQVNKSTHKTKYNTQVTKTESFTTDDLVRVSPTGRDFNVVKLNKSGNSGHKSHRYSTNRFAKVAWDDEQHTSHSRSGMGDRNKSSQENKMAASSQHTVDTGLSTNTDSLIYTPPRAGLASQRQHDSRLANTYHGKTQHDSRLTNTYNGYDKTRLGKASVHQGEDKLFRRTPHASKDESRVKERARKILDMTDTPRTRLQSSPSGEGTSVIPSLHTSPIAVGVDNARSFLTEDILEGDRSWEKHLPSIKPPHPVEERSHQQGVSTAGVLDQFLDDCLVSSNQESPRLTNGRQPGPVEALKNMLFTLQQITPDQQDIDQNKKEHPMESHQTEELQAHSSKRPVLDTASSSPKDRNLSPSSSSTITTTDFDEAPGGKSLQRAMHHLSRLKSLVYDSASSMDDEQSSKPSSYKALPMTSR